MRRVRTRLVVFAVIGLAVASICAQHTKENSQSSDATPVPCVIFGAVHSPARLELRRKVKLSEGLSLIGGVSDRANGIVKIVHTERGFDRNSEEVYKLADITSNESNPYLEPGDIVVVEEWEPVYVTGYVAKPQEILKGSLTLTQAIELAGGVTSDSETTKVVIYRLQDRVLRKTEVAVNFAAIKKHRMPDLILKPYDIVDVGDTGQLTPPFPYPTVSVVGMGLTFTYHVIY